MQLTERQRELVTKALYDRASMARLHHRTGETFTEPLFAEWIHIANAFRDAAVVTIQPKSTEAVA
jgi:hypothetical protein